MIDGIALSDRRGCTANARRPRRELGAVLAAGERHPVVVE